MLLVRGGSVWTGLECLTDAAVLCDRGEVVTVGGWEGLRARAPRAIVVGGPDDPRLPGAERAAVGLRRYAVGPSPRPLGGRGCTCRRTRWRCPTSASSHGAHTAARWWHLERLGLLGDRRGRQGDPVRRGGGTARGRAGRLHGRRPEGRRRPWTHPAIHPVALAVHRATARHVVATVVEGRVAWEPERGEARLALAAEALAATCSAALGGQPAPPAAGAPSAT